MTMTFSNIINQDNLNRDNPDKIKNFILEKQFWKNFSKVFDINNYFEDFNIIIKTKNKIQKYKKIFSNLARNYPAYNILNSFLKNKTELIDGIYLYFYD